jgi:hypothetical protein
MAEKKNNNNNHLVIMSPLLSNKINNLEEKVENIDIKLDKILNILSGQEISWNENKKQYIDSLDNIKEISKENLKILNENRSIFNQIQDTEKNELLPILDKLQSNNKKLFNNLNNKNIESRLSNIYWRSSNNTTMKPTYHGLNTILANYIGNSGNYL